MMTYEHDQDLLIITLTGDPNILRFALSMLDAQVEFSEVGRGVLVELRERCGEEAFGRMLRAAVGGERLGFLLGSWLRRDAICAGCDGEVANGHGVHLPLAQVICQGCAA